MIRKYTMAINKNMNGHLDIKKEVGRHGIETLI